MTAREALRRAIQSDEIVVAPVCINAITARIIQKLGFSACYLGGYAFGAASCLTEPLTTMMEIVEAAQHIARRIDLPLIVDADAGFGEPLHTMRTMQEFEWAGVAGVHIEDQIFPKRAHYHKDYQEHVIPIEEMQMKIRLAVQARQDPNFVIIGRTDSMRTDGYDEGVKRARAYLEAGADMIMLFPNDLAEVKRAPKDIPGPLVYVTSWGNTVKRPVLNTRELGRLGYRMVVEAQPALFATVMAVEDCYRHLKEDGICNFDNERMRALRQDVEALIDLPKYFEIEAGTVER